ncbi:hypothetical protein GCM10023196_037950 [Actinoallomurus vinaceus]|uniref:Uncharacterized protein n=1 Tax=Actinoallomurus vinaceus TaxID=1080074 RepID=A0ABP8UB41_9ACTN
MRKLSMALAGAVALGGLALTTGTASAGTVHTESSWPKGSKFAAYFKGHGLKVDQVTVWNKKIKNGKPTVWGWGYVEVSEPKHKFRIIWASKYTKKPGKPSIVVWKTGKKFANGTLLCAGVAPTKAFVNHVGTACAKVHS